mmetsp:Transcript_12193/g.29577  ORF Transcript_12193/g.29577 Transcript_12193/m.29577 type:complete len:410 (+) Transcript_12193:297-1526(+)|eukprot:CAMPEP_0178994576 /NCGR_PEP_ID=MMETSP0795-20121207/7347_1 /TAXON_ID=88552 /ORGANISM="Amoebophrya sp., Strain Ameob2" /LENGTH=409 /DNA_ID=CAMNT_0020686785 /DNA_START=250 /DNA_END=1479 /DNA_ORIENTATION=-
MGCALSSNPKPGDVKVEQLRRRLTVSNLDEMGGGGEDAEPTNEHERGLLHKVTEKSVIEIADELDEMLNGSPLKSERSSRSGVPKRRVSIGSETDKNANKRQSFKKKDEYQLGDNLGEEELKLGYSCRKGLKPESPNQDSWFVLVSENDLAIYGVFDGHGAKGHDVSNLVKEYLPKLLLVSDKFREAPQEVMQEAFLSMQKLIVAHDKKGILNAQLSGTTCTVVVHDMIKNCLVVAHVGDSRAVMVKRDGTRAVSEDLTIDHKPDLKEEKAYVERHGGRVAFDGFANHRVYVRNGTYPGLNMSRALGDILGSTNAGINNTPDVRVVPLPPRDTEDNTLNAQGTRAVLLICSDGVWEFISSSQATDMVLRFDAAHARDAAEKLAKEAWDRWIREEGGFVVDDITALVIYI